MTKIHHINCGTLLVSGYPTVVCHCLLLEDEQGLTLIDTGIGLLDVQDPAGRLGQDLIDLAGFQFNEVDTAVRKIEKLGLSPDRVDHIVLTHCDPDHTGGLADFPNATIHLAKEELDQLNNELPRYVSSHFEHRPKWAFCEHNDREWFGLKARSLPLEHSSEVLLIPLFGHTLGHCGVAIQQGDRWLLHAGDAYYLRPELSEENHPVDAFAAQRAEDDQMRRKSLSELRRLFRDHHDQIDFVGYHDINELPSEQRD
ncbi:MBL fold metallo-hydrolase [Thalassoglobus sp. JC818]|uniref:MBL fold metallo-hydrolase n=1 Tax=Thalassoglobus sp. JC818 TaxID=3232136 RepID=UPI003458F351